MTQPLIAVVGPTASGKSDLGISLAQRFNGEIVNCDSVQLYRGLYVATAKVPLEEQAGIPHHLIDVAEPTENVTAVAWAEMARKTISQIEEKGKLAILVGGTGFYLKALSQDFFEAPDSKPELRARLQASAQRRGSEHMHRMLRRLDPNAAGRFAVNDTFRVIRALEVYFLSGRPLSQLQKEKPMTVTAEGARMKYLILEPDRDQLYTRINKRADEMIARGLLDEINNLIESGVPRDAKAFGAHGYRRFIEHLQGTRSLESAIDQMKLDTRHYAKRQWSWWRAQNSTYWLKGFGFENHIVDQASNIVAELLSAR